MKMWIFGMAALAAATCFGAASEDGVTKERRGALGPNDTVVTDVDTTGIVAARTYTKDEVDRRIATNAPVRSVNGRTGRVVLGASDVGALPNNRDDLKASANFRNAVWDVQIKNGGGVDTNAVREIAGEVVAPVEAAVADRYTKSEAEGLFMRLSGTNEIESNFVLHSSYTGQNVIYNDGPDWRFRGIAFSAGIAERVGWDGVLGKPTTLSGYGITDAKIESGTIYLGSQTITPILNGGSGSMSTLSVTGDFLESFAPIYKRNPLDGSSSEIVYGISTNGTDYLHADVNLKPWGDSLISASNPAFSNAVLTVGIDTNAVAQIGELKEFFDGLPVGTVGTSLGGIILALLAAVSWLKKNALTDGLETDGTPTDVKLDKFFTESNSLLNARITYERNATGLKDRAFNALTFDGAEYNLSAALASVTPTSDGQPRDLLIVATATAATTISFTAGTIKGDKPTIDGAGTWLITLTEYAANTWYCRQIKMEDAQ